MSVVVVFAVVATAVVVVVEDEVVGMRKLSQVMTFVADGPDGIGLITRRVRERRQC